METPTITYSDCVGPVSAFMLELHYEGRFAPVSLYVTANDADHIASTLSKLNPTADIRLVKMARIKAMYKNGERTKLTNYHDFYVGLTEEQYTATLIKDSRTAEMI